MSPKGPDGCTRFDVHCHYFNGAYAFREALAIGWNAMWGNYPHRTDRAMRLPAKPLRGLENWKRVSLTT